ncbi:hypothetical protein K438DRAFT_1994888 [Mycena galopus ATCC 62051]|nr:hypothetical protein K438DRAFT_1994888 [Mycena galopus ATCC 62051]
MSSHQPGITRPYRAVTNKFVQYESRLPGHPIMLSESIDACVVTPAIAASTTLTMCIATCSTIVVMYPELVDRRRAHSGWFSPTVESCFKLQDCGFRHSVSTAQWNEACGWNCPVLSRRIQGLEGAPGTGCAQ